MFVFGRAKTSILEGTLFSRTNESGANLGGGDIRTEDGPINAFALRNLVNSLVYIALMTTHSLPSVKSPSIRPNPAQQFAMGSGRSSSEDVGCCRSNVGTNSSAECMNIQTEDELRGRKKVRKDGKDKVTKGTIHTNYTDKVTKGIIHANYTDKVTKGTIRTDYEQVRKGRGSCLVRQIPQIT